MAQRAKRARQQSRACRLPPRAPAGPVGGAMALQTPRRLSNLVPRREESLHWPRARRSNRLGEPPAPVLEAKKHGKTCIARAQHSIVGGLRSGVAANPRSISGYRCYAPGIRFVSRRRGYSIPNCVIDCSRYPRSGEDAVVRGPNAKTAGTICPMGEASLRRRNRAKNGYDAQIRDYGCSGVW